MKTVIYSLAAISTVMLSGCLSRDVVVNLDVSVPDAFGNASLAAGAETDDATWWASFGDPQMSALIEKALENNRSLKAAQGVLDNARAERRSAVADLMPSFGATGMALDNLTLVNPDGRTTGHLYGLSAQWDIDIFGQGRNIARAKNQLRYAAAEKQRGARMTVASETAKAYLTWRNVAARMLVVKAGVQTKQEALDLAQGRLEGGLSSTVDVDKAKAELAAARALLPKLESADAKLRAALAVLTGEVASGYHLDAGVAWSDIKVPEPPELLPSTVLLRRPDVQAAKRTVEAQMFAVGAAKAAYFPKFSFAMLAAKEYLQFSPFLYAYTESGTYNTDLDGDVTQASLSATLPIFTFGKIRAAVKAQKAKLDSVAALYENTILTAIAETECAYQSFASTRSSGDSLRESSESAKAALDKVEGLYDGGLADMTDVLGARATSLQQADACLQAGLEHAIAAVDLHDALGGFDADGVSE